MKKLLIISTIFSLFILTGCGNNISREEKEIMKEIEKDIKTFEKSEEVKEEVVKGYSSKGDYIYWDGKKILGSTYKGFVDYRNGYAKDENFTYLCGKHEEFGNIDVESLEFDNNGYGTDENTYYYRYNECEIPYIIAKKIKFTNLKNNEDEKVYEQLVWNENIKTKQFGLKADVDFNNLYIWCNENDCLFYSEKGKNDLLEFMDNNGGKVPWPAQYWFLRGNMKEITSRHEFKSLDEGYLMTVKDDKNMKVLYKGKLMDSQPDLETFQKFKDGLWKDKDRMYLNGKVYNG